MQNVIIIIINLNEILLIKVINVNWLVFYKNRE